MIETLLTAYLGLSTNYTEFSREDLRNLLDELRGLSDRIKFPMYEYGTPTATINLMPPHSNEYPEIIDWWDGNLPSMPEILSIQARVLLPEQPFILESLSGEIRQAVQGSDALAHHRLGARRVFVKRIWDMVVIANIASVGVLDPIKSVIIQDGEPVEDIGGYITTDALWDAWEVADEMGWPKLRVIEFARAWEWAINQQGFLDGFGNAPVGRALNAFTQVLNPDSAFGPMQLFWALMGIEALYTKGKYNVLRQVKKNCQVLLGSQESFDEKMTEMYEFRSRLIHGDLDFPGHPVMFDADKRLAEHDERLRESTALTVAILLAALQELIQRG